MSVASLEHVNVDVREKALKEMIRVARKKVVIYCPLNYGDLYVSRRYDMAFQSWIVELSGMPNEFTAEHINNVSPDLLRLSVLALRCILRSMPMFG